MDTVAEAALSMSKYRCARGGSLSVASSTMSKTMAGAKEHLSDSPRTHHYYPPSLDLNDFGCQSGLQLPDIQRYVLYTFVRREHEGETYEDRDRLVTSTLKYRNAEIQKDTARCNDTATEIQSDSQTEKYTHISVREPFVNYLSVNHTFVSHLSQKLQFVIIMHGSNAKGFNCLQLSRATFQQQSP